MTDYGWLTFYSALILLISLLGGSVPFLSRVTHSRLQFYLSLSAGVMLGASFFHVMPDAMEMSGPYFGWWMSLGVVGLFCIERFIAPHSHELDGSGGHAHGEHHHHKDDEHRQSHGDEPHGGHAHGPNQGAEHRAAAPAVAGWMAVVGLTIHTFMNGVGLAGAVQLGLEQQKSGTTPGNAGTLLVWPGMAMFLAIFFHKPADALAISTVLSRKGVSRDRLLLVQFAFACMVPIGAAAFLLTRGAIEENLRTQLTGAALAFSAGTFLFIALSDLLPEVQFHRHDRIPLFLALVIGVVGMGGIALLEGHEHGGDEHGSHPHAAQAHPGEHGYEDEHGPGHEHDHDHDQH
jgi:zinc and cadmium transporter